MALSEVSQPGQTAFVNNARLLQNLKDYTLMSVSLLWQRQLIFLAATLLTAFYFDPFKASLFYGCIMLCEFWDLLLARRVAELRDDEHRAILFYFTCILVNTLVSATAICMYAVTVALQQEAGGHFTPLFFLFAAALFAAMNNHQIVMALVLRLVMYGVSFMIIVLEDIWAENPPLSSDLWLHFFTVVFVMYFLIDCSIVFLNLYRKNLLQLETLRNEHERTKAAYLAKSQFVSTVSHELRTPLTSIKGSLDLLNSGAMGEIPEQMQSLVQLAGRNSSRLSELIDDVLDLQKIESGEMTYRIEVLNVQTLIDEAVSCSGGYAETHGVSVTNCIEDEDPLFIEGDEARLMQVMSNIISNGIKFSNEGGIVEVGCQRAGDKVRITIRDHGVGIPEGARDKVFDRFTQLDSSDRRQVGGTGLGMSISKEIVEHLNGTIDYESELGQGTKFFVEFTAFEHRESTM
ncbi:sensor histidine kinase [Primorskyibacter sp. S87]|uniref:sensor histidine kinase n=1 Tax=Primorskyibacter sp. S87 TaxID=3415126 RepID=UPI003C7DD680